MKASLDFPQWMRGLSPSGLQLLSNVLGWQWIWHTVSLDNRDSGAQWHSALCSSVIIWDSVLFWILGIKRIAFWNLEIKLIWIACASYAWGLVWFTIPAAHTKVQSIRDNRMPNPQWRICTVHPPAKAQGTLQKRRQKVCQSQWQWMTTNGNSRAVEHVHSHWLWHHTQHLCKSKADWTPTWRHWAGRSIFHLGYYCKLRREERSVFSKSIGPDKSIILW